MSSMRTYASNVGTCAGVCPVEAPVSSNTDKKD